MIPYRTCVIQFSSICLAGEIGQKITPADKSETRSLPICGHMSDAVFCQLSFVGQSPEQMVYTQPCPLRTMFRSKRGLILPPSRRQQVIDVVDFIKYKPLNVSV